MKMTLRVRQQNAFTMWEVVIAITMFSIGLMSMVNFIPSLSRVNNRAIQHAQASFIADMLIAEAKKDALTLSDTEFENLDDGKWGSNAQVFVKTPLANGERETLGGGKIKWSSQLTTLSDVYQVNISIHTRDRGDTITHSFVTYVQKD